MNKRQEHWKTRIQEDIKKHPEAKLIILNININSINELQTDIELKLHQNTTNIPLQQPTQNQIEIKIAKFAITRFLQRWKKKHKISLRHWLVIKPRTKQTQNIKLYGIAYTDHLQDLANKWLYGKIYIIENINQKTINQIIDLKNKHKLTILTTPQIGKKL